MNEQRYYNTNINWKGLLWFTGRGGPINFQVYMGKHNAGTHPSVQEVPRAGLSNWVANVSWGSTKYQTPHEDIGIMSPHSHHKPIWQKLLSTFYRWGNRNLFVHLASNYFGEFIIGLKQWTQPQNPLLRKITFMWSRTERGKKVTCQAAIRVK